jgi:hypothetical protein
MTSFVELIGDLLDLAEKKLGERAEWLLQTVSLSGLESMLAGLEAGEVQLSRVEQAAVCGAWVIRHQPFPKYNREIGYGFMRLLLKQAGVPWPRAQEDAQRIDARLQALEAGVTSEAKFVDWVCLRVAVAQVVPSGPAGTFGSPRP